MISEFIALFRWLHQLWESVPAKTREDIYEKMSALFEEIFRQYYRSQSK